jgi:hypothetical protein
VEGKAICLSHFEEAVEEVEKVLVSAAVSACQQRVHSLTRHFAALEAWAVDVWLKGQSFLP